MSSSLYKRFITLALGAALFVVAAPHEAWSQPKAAKPTPVVGANVTLHYRPPTRRRGCRPA